MPRRPRVILPNVPQHIIQRGNNRQACFYANEDYLSYLEGLKEYSDKTECKIHAYALMTNHVHLLVSAGKVEAIAAMMKALGQRYVQYVNKMHQRTGTLWEGRYKSCPIQAETYLLACQRYIELNPVRANMVSHSAEYRWSSYAANAQGADSKIIQQHILYQALGLDSASRQAAYRELFRFQLDVGLVDEIRKATNGNYALGNDLFTAQIAQTLGRRVTAGKAGRPKLKPAKVL
ncbi:MAG: transposase [Methylotenera sp.]|nr:transposase [Methylotenera sp.]